MTKSSHDETTPSTEASSQEETASTQEETTLTVESASSEDTNVPEPSTETVSGTESAFATDSLEVPADSDDTSESDGKKQSSGTPSMYSAEWEATFADLPTLSYQEAVAKITAGGVIRDCKIPFLNLVTANVEQTVIFEHCDLGGCLALGTHFQGNLEIRNCWVHDRFVLGDKRDDNSSAPSVLHGNLRVEHCRFEERFNVYRSEIKGDVVFLQSSSGSFLSWDRTVLDGFLRVEGPGKSHGLSVHRAHIKGGMSLKGIEIVPHVESNKPLLNFSKATIESGVELVKCNVQGRTECYRLNAGENSYQALYIKDSTLDNLFLKQASFHGKCLIEGTTFHGEVSANPPRSEHGHVRGRSATFYSELTLGYTTVKGGFNFQNAEIKGPANFSHCNLEKGGAFNQATFGDTVSFWKSVASKEVHFRKAHFIGAANFGHATLGHRSSFNESVFEAGASFFDARLGGDAFFSNAEFHENLKMGRLQCAGGLNLKEVKVQGELNLVNANIKDRWIASNSQLHSVIAQGLQVGTWASLADCQIHDEVHLEGMKVGTKAEPAKEGDKFVPGSFYLDNVVLHQPFTMNNADVAGTLSFEGASVHRELELIHCRVGHDLVLAKGYYRDVIRCERSQIKQTLKATLSRFREEVTWNQISCQSATMGGSSFDQGFTLRGTSITDSLSLNNVDVTGKADLSKCSFQRFFFDHLLVDYLMVEREQIGERLASEQAGNYAQAKNEYGILRQAFLVRNRYADMDWAYYRFCQANRREKSQSPLTFLEWVLFDLGFGYGTRPMNIALVALSLVLIFAGMFYAFPAGIADHTGAMIKSLSFLDSIHLSVLTFASMEFSSHQPHALHALKYAFALEGLLGIFLITLFVATISRKIIRT